MVSVSSCCLAFNVLLLSGFLSRLAHARPTERDVGSGSLFVNPVPPEASLDFQSIYGPVVASNFPDPSVIYLNGTSYAFATNNKGFGPYGMIHVQVATSIDNQTWTLIEGLDALPTVANWQSPKGVWAPDVVQLVCQSWNPLTICAICLTHCRMTAHSSCTIPACQIRHLVTIASVRRLPKPSPVPI